MATPDRILNQCDIMTALDALAALRDRAGDAHCLVGFDGFVDSIIDAVARRHAPGPDGYERMTSLLGFADRARDASGRSANIELVVKQTRAGGNGPILAGALAQLGATTDCIGAIDHPIFDELRNACAATTSLGEPGATDALEFNDGKLMLGKSAPMDRITWDNIVTQAGGLDALIARCNSAGIIAPCGWTMIPAMNDIWAHLANEVLPALDQSRSRVFFVDFSDPAKRPEAGLRAAIRLLQRINALAPVTLGLNLAEANRIGSLVGAGENDIAEPESIMSHARALRDAIGISRVAIHHHKAAALVDENARCAMATQFTPTPKTSTGAGDHFNAGLCFSLAHGLDIPTTLACAVATSGLFVRTGQHPSLMGVVELLNSL